jgi:membrane protein required for colicin V production
MTWIDAAIVITFIFFIVTAFTAGFIRETVAMAAAIAGAVLAGLLYDDVAETLLSSIDNETTAAVAGFLIVFFSIALIGQAVAMVMKPAANVMQLGIVDQLLGAGFGAVKAFVLIQVVLIVFVTYPRYDLDDKIDQSEFASVMLEASEPMVKVLPEEFESRVTLFKQGSQADELPDLEQQANN